MIALLLVSLLATASYGELLDRYVVEAELDALLTPAEPLRYSNRIHRDDLAAFSFCQTATIELPISNHAHAASFSLISRMQAKLATSSTQTRLNSSPPSSLVSSRKV